MVWFFIEKLVRNEDGPPHKLLYKENGKKKCKELLCRSGSSSVGRSFKRVFFFSFFFSFTYINALVFFVYLYR